MKRQRAWQMVLLGVLITMFRAHQAVMGEEVAESRHGKQSQGGDGGHLFQRLPADLDFKI